LAKGPACPGIGDGFLFPGGKWEPVPNSAIPDIVSNRGGASKVIDLIKGMENGEARKRKAGETFLDLSALRSELGVGSGEG